MPDFATLKPVSSQPDFNSLQPLNSDTLFKNLVSSPTAFKAGTPSLSTLGSNLAQLPGQVVGAVKAGASAVTGAEQGLGKEIAAAVGAGGAQKQATDLNQQHQQTLDSAINLRNSFKASGKDTSKLDAIISSLQAEAPHQVSDVLPAVNDTPGQVAGNAAGVAGDIFGFGSYSKAGLVGDKALTTGLEKGAPTAITAAKGALDTTKNVISNGSSAVKNGTVPVIQKLLLGKEGLKTLSQIANPEAKAFVPVEQGGLGKTISTVATATQKAVDSFVNTSKAALQTVKNEIPTNIKIPKENVADAVNNGILKSVQGSADYHGVQGNVATLFKTPESLINSGLLNPEEAGRVKGIVDVVKNWSDDSARGILNLKEQLAPFYKEGLNGSNNILSKIQNNLKDLVIKVHPAIKPALETASSNIDKAEEFTRHLLGNNPATTETKLVAIAKNLKNPAVKGYQHSLLDDLKTATGHDVVPQLKGYADYLDLLDKDFPTKKGTIIKNVGTRVAKTAIGASVLAGSKHILGLK